MKQPNGPDGEYVRERKPARRHNPFGELQQASEVPRACKLGSVVRQSEGSTAIEEACSLDRHRAPHPRATIPCAA